MMKILEINRKEYAQGIISLCRGEILDKENGRIKVHDSWLATIREEMGPVYVQHLKDMNIVTEYPA